MLKCDTCERKCPIGSLDRSGACTAIKYVCENCLEYGIVHKCDTCGSFIQHNPWDFFKYTPYGNFYDYLQTKRFDNKHYCDKCKPPIIFYFNLVKSFSQIEIQIPIENEWHLEWNYFFDIIAAGLNVPISKISIDGHHYGNSDTLCPAEYVTEEHRTFDVLILD